MKRVDVEAFLRENLLARLLPYLLPGAVLMLDKVIVLPALLPREP